MQNIIEEAILEAAKNPLDACLFCPKIEQTERIKAIFVGEQNKIHIRIAFQRFKKEQYITTKGINLFLTVKLLLKKNDLE